MTFKIITLDPSDLQGTAMLDLLRQITSQNPENSQGEITKTRQTQEAPLSSNGNLAEQLARYGSIYSAAKQFVNELSPKPDLIPGLYHFDNWGNLHSVSFTTVEAYDMSKIDSIHSHKIKEGDHVQMDQVIVAIMNEFVRPSGGALPRHLIRINADNTIDVTRFRIMIASGRAALVEDYDLYFEENGLATPSDRYHILYALPDELKAF